MSAAGWLPQRRHTTTNAGRQPGHVQIDATVTEKPYASSPLWKKRRKSVVPMPHAVEMLAQMSNEIASEEASNAVAPRPWRPALFAAGLALAAVLGSSVQSLPTLGFAQLWREAAGNPPLRMPTRCTRYRLSLRL